MANQVFAGKEKTGLQLANATSQGKKKKNQIKPNMTIDKPLETVAL